MVVCNTRSMSRAAHLLSVTQGAVSQQISKLETNLGLPLLERRGRTLHVLPAGNNLLFHARRILHDVRVCEQSLQRFTGFSYPEISLGVINTMSKILSPPLMDALDGVVDRIHLRTSVSMRHDEEIAEGRIDILVSAQYFDPEIYEIHPVASEPLVGLAPKGYRPEREGEDGLKQLAETLPLAHFSPRRQVGRLSRDYLAGKRLAIRRDMEFDQITSMLELVQRRAGWAIATPFCLLDAAIPLDDLDIFLLPPPTPSRTISVIARREHFGNLAGTLAERCRQHIRETALRALAPHMPPGCMPRIN